MEATVGDSVIAVRLTGTITSITFEMVKEAVEYAEVSGSVVLLLLDTPGGSLDATFRIIETIERSRMPVIGYVYPPGGRAWSAGTFILMATHVAAMAPNTIIGSAQPVSYDPLGGGSAPIDDPKLINALTKYIGERARRNSRDAETAVKFVSENLNLNDEETLAAGVIEYRAPTIFELLKTVDGRSVEVASGSVVLRTLGSRVTDWSPSLRVSTLSLISEPMVAYLLFIIGFYALFFGLQSPGVGLEVAGAVMLVMGLMGLGVVGINIGALFIMVVGFGLLIAEMLSPGFGVFGSIGFLCVAIGSFLLLPREWSVQSEWLNALYTVLIVVPLAAGATVIFIVYKVVEARRRRPYQASPVGESGWAEGEIDSEKGGYILVLGELWKAKSDQTIPDKAQVKIVGKEGPTLIVEPMKPREGSLEDRI